MSQNAWDAALYDRQYGFVWQQALDLVTLLSPQSHERVLDLGCGTGHLTALIAESGAETVGIDASPAMIEQARLNFPTLQFQVADALDFEAHDRFDAVFTNATLHWILEPMRVVMRVHEALKAGGRFVGEFGGQGNLHRLLEGLRAAVDETGLSLPSLTSWYFPSVEEYRVLLERQGFRVVSATLFDRLTPLAGGEKGLQAWMGMFVKWLFQDLTIEQQGRVLSELERRLRPILYRNGTWFADYRRLRFYAVR
jgi:trans-aconitate 2-methyltransferase